MDIRGACSDLVNFTVKQRGREGRMKRRLLLQNSIISKPSFATNLHFMCTSFHDFPVIISSFFQFMKSILHYYDVNLILYILQHK